VHVEVLYFAVCRERLGRDHERVELPEDATVAVLLDHLGARHAPLVDLRRYLRVAVDRELARDTDALHDGAEVALIPPVAGG
jgi:molybdopterin synthase catalytic subunit